MSKYKHKAEDIVQICSKEWITKHKPIIERFGVNTNVNYKLKNGRLFNNRYINYCGETMVIEEVWNEWFCKDCGYSLKDLPETGMGWYDEMFETKWSLRLQRIKDFIRKIMAYET